MQLSSNRRSINKSFLPPANQSRQGRSTSLKHNISHHIVREAQKLSSKIPPPPKPLSFYVGRGNNENIVRKVLLARTNWIESDDSTSAFINFKWQQDQKGIHYNRLFENGQYRTTVNHLQFHEWLSNKEYLFRSLEKYAQKNGIDLWSIVPPTFILNCKDECCMQLFTLFVQYYSKHYPKALKDRAPQEVDKEILEEKRRMKVYFANSNLKKILPKNPPMPPVFINKDQGDYLWIVKPTFLNRGRGIQLFYGLKEFRKFVSENISGYLEKKVDTSQISKPKPFIDYIKKNSQNIRVPLHHQQQIREQNLRQIQMKKMEQTDPESAFDGNLYIRVIPNCPALIKTDCFLVQKYLQRPLLIFNRKFDVRVWVLVTHLMKVYVFPEGYIRLSSSEYSCQKTEDASFVHLTNNSIQRFSNQYGKVSEGNQLSFQELRAVMEEKELSFENCRNKMYDHVKVSMNATIKKLNEFDRKFSFQIFGYDFMIDEMGHPWLIEVNTNPCLDESSKLLKALLPRMLDDAFKLTIDNLFFGSFSNGNFPIEGYSKENMWVNLQLS